MKYQFSAGLCIDGAYFDTDRLLDSDVKAVLTETGGEYLYRRMTLTNIGTVNSKQITEPHTLNANLPCEKELLFHTLKGDDNSKDSFMPVDKSISIGEKIILTPSGGRSSSTTAFPFMDFTIDGKVLLLAIGWTGKWKCVIERNENAVHITIGLAYADFFLYPNESVELPSVFLLEGKEGESADSVRRRCRKILLTDMNPLEKGKKLPVSIDPFGHFHQDGFFKIQKSEESLSGLNQIGGIDAYCLDVDLFSACFSNELKFLSDATQRPEKELLIGFEPEKICAESDVFDLHPEFLLACETDEKNYLYNLGDEEVYAWIYRLLSDFIRINEIRYFCHNFNISPLPYWTENDEENREGICEIKYIMGLYRLWDDLKSEFPDLCIFNCSNGGRRIDLETIKRAVPIRRSALSCQPSTKAYPTDVRNQNQILSLSEYIPYHSAFVGELKANDIRSSATEGISFVFPVLDSDFESADMAIGEVKSLQKYWNGDFYALEKPTLKENGFVAYQLAKEDCGYAAIFRREKCTNDWYSLRLQNVDMFANYRISITDENYIQKEQNIRGSILFKGFDLYFPLPKTSAIVTYQKIN